MSVRMAPRIRMWLRGSVAAPTLSATKRLGNGGTARCGVPSWVSYG